MNIMKCFCWVWWTFTFQFRLYLEVNTVLCNKNFMSLNQTDSRALEVKSLTNAPHPREQINPFSKALHIWQMLSSHLSDPSFTPKHWNTHCYEHILSISLTLPPMINRHTQHRSHTPVIKFRTVVLVCLFWFLSLLFTSLFWPLTVDLLTSLQETSMSLCGRSYVSPMI